MLSEKAKDGGGSVGSLARGPLQALPDAEGSAGRSRWTVPQLQVRDAWRTYEKTPMANLVLCISFFLRAVELGTKEWDAHAPFRSHVFNLVRIAGVLENGLQTTLLGCYFTVRWLTLLS